MDNAFGRSNQRNIDYKGYGFFTAILVLTLCVVCMMWVCFWVYMYVWAHIYVCVCGCMYECVFVCMWKRVRVWRRVSSVVEHSSANPKVPGSIPGPVSYRGHGL